MKFIIQEPSPFQPFWGFLFRGLKQSNFSLKVLISTVSFIRVSALAHVIEFGSSKSNVEENHTVPKWVLFHLGFSAGAPNLYWPRSHIGPMTSRGPCTLMGYERVS